MTSTMEDRPRLAKSATGIKGFDQITGGGLPTGRATLVTGASGSGKSLFGLEFLVRGARDLGEPGVLLAFEESAGELATNVASLGFDLADLERRGLLVVDAFHIDPSEIVTTGAFDLEGLFLRLGLAVDAVGAKRVVLDTVEVLFGAFSAFGDEGLVRGELSRLFRWLKDRGLTAVITGERGREGQLTRFGIEEYVSDCVIVLDHRVHDDISTRRLRVAKYRGSEHGTNEYPFLITDRGFMVLPVTSLGLDYDACDERVSTGLQRLDHMLNGGVHRGSSVLVSGGAGTGKTTISAQMVDAACARGERALFVSFEESPSQLVRNMRSVGIDLARWVDQGLLRIWAERATAYGLEAHVGRLDLMLDEVQPAIVVLDAIASLWHVGSANEVTSAIARELDLVKARGMTAVLTTLTHDGDGETSPVFVSSLIDTWLLLRNVESGGERNRLLFVIKSRGTAHSNQVREFVLTDHGAQLLDVYVGPRGVLTGTARTIELANESAAADDREQENSRRRDRLSLQTAEMQARVLALQEQLRADTEELQRLTTDDGRREQTRLTLRAALGAQRGVDPEPAGSLP